MTRNVYISPTTGRPFTDWPPSCYVTKDPEVNRRNAHRCLEMARGDARRAASARAKGHFECVLFWNAYATRMLAFALWHRDMVSAGT